MSEISCLAARRSKTSKKGASCGIGKRQRALGGATERRASGLGENNRHAARACICEGGSDNHPETIIGLSTGETVSTPGRPIWTGRPGQRLVWGGWTKPQDMKCGQISVWGAILTVFDGSWNLPRISRTLRHLSLRKSRSPLTFVEKGTSRSGAQFSVYYPAQPRRRERRERDARS